MGSVCNRDTCDVRRLRWYDDFLLLRGRSTVGDSLRVRPRLANIHAVDKRICGTGGLCTVDCRRIRLLGLCMLHGNMETLAVGSYATPVFSTASSTVLLGVALGVPFWIGVVLVVAGSLINLWFARRAR